MSNKCLSLIILSLLAITELAQARNAYRGHQPQTQRGLDGFQDSSEELQPEHKHHPHCHHPPPQQQQRHHSHQMQHNEQNYRSIAEDQLKSNNGNYRSNTEDQLKNNNGNLSKVSSKPTHVVQPPSPSSVQSSSSPRTTTNKTPITTQPQSPDKAQDPGRTASNLPNNDAATQNTQIPQPRAIAGPSTALRTTANALDQEEGTSKPLIFMHPNVETSTKALPQPNQPQPQPQPQQPQPQPQPQQPQEGDVPKTKNGDAIKISVDNRGLFDTPPMCADGKELQGGRCRQKV